MRTDSINDWRREALSHARECYPAESCGAVVLIDGAERYVPCRSISQAGDAFQVAPMDIVRVEDEFGSPAAWVHSHPDQDRLRASSDDVAGCDHSRVPWHITSWPHGGWLTIDPAHTIAPLEGREFVHGSVDCYSLIRDWYRLERRIVLPDFRRDDGWWDTDQSLYADHYAEAGFVAVDGPPQPGDVLLMRAGTRSKPNHAAVYLGGDQMIHHFRGRLSCTEDWDTHWQGRTMLVVRYADA